MQNYLQNNALGLLLPEDQSQGSTLGGLGLSTIHGPGTTLQSSHLSDVLGDYNKRMDAIEVPKMGQGQAKNPYSAGIATQQAAESDPYSIGSQEYDPGVQYTSIYQTGNILG